MAFKPQPLNQEEYSMKIIEDLGNIPGPSGRKARYAVMECTSCNQGFRLRMGSTKAKQQTQCGICANTKHSNSYEPLYSIWNGIIQRCYSKKRKDYARYGGVGVTMCDEWKNSPEKFIDWCKANGWKPGLVVDKDIKSRLQNISPAIYSPETISFISAQRNAEEANGKPVEQYSLTGELLAEFPSAVKAALSLDKPYSAKSVIANCCRGVSKTAYKFKWKYKDLNHRT